MRATSCSSLYVLFALSVSLLCSTIALGQTMDASAVDDASVSPSGDASPPTSVDASITVQPSGDASTTAVTISTPRVVLVDTAPIGVDPAAGTFVDTVLRQQFAQLGFTIVPQEELYATARRLSLPFPVPEQGLAALTQELDAAMVFACDLRARSGYYFATVRLRRSDESAERSLAVVATQWTLGDRVREAVLLLLRGANQSSVTTASPSSVEPTAPVVMPSYYTGNVAVPAPPAVLIHPRPFELGLLAHGAFNPGRDPYTNVLAGARFAYFPMDRLGISGSLQYANLRGRSGRVHNLLPLVGVETAVDLVPSVGLFVPVRAELGYLPFNGPVLRLTAGVAFTVYRQLRLELDFVQPTIWWVNENASVSLDVGAYLTWTFGVDRSAPVRRRRRRRAPSSTVAPQHATTTHENTTRATNSAQP
jgi:hypothetical protein